MLGERREHQRFKINRTARIQTDITTASRECTVTDISDRGARLFVPNLEVPDQFSLLLSGDKSIRQDCRVVWRLGGEVGVEFAPNKPDQTRLEAMRSLREQARQVFGSKR